MAIVPSPELYVAYTGGEFVESATTLAELMAILEEVCDDGNGEDVVVWRGSRLVLIRLADGPAMTIRQEGRR